MYIFSPLTQNTSEFVQNRFSGLAARVSCPWTYRQTLSKYQATYCGVREHQMDIKCCNQKVKGQPKTTKYSEKNTRCVKKLKDA